MAACVQATTCRRRGRPSSEPRVAPRPGAAGSGCAASGAGPPGTTRPDALRRSHPRRTTPQAPVAADHRDDLGDRTSPWCRRCRPACRRECAARRRRRAAFWASMRAHHVRAELPGGSPPGDLVAEPVAHEPGRDQRALLDLLVAGQIEEGVGEDRAGDLHEGLVVGALDAEEALRGAGRDRPRITRDDVDLAAGGIDPGQRPPGRRRP